MNLPQLKTRVARLAATAAIPYGPADVYDWKRHAIMLSLALALLYWTWTGYRERGS